MLNDDPEYLIANLLLPARERFSPDGKRFMFNSYSFGVVSSKIGPAIVDEAIEYIRELSARSEKSPVKWSDVLGSRAEEELAGVGKRLFDLKQVKGILGMSRIGEV
jgi:hypothetical protein